MDLYPSKTMLRAFHPVWTVRSSGRNAGGNGFHEA
jgi:hypothetical protein